MDGDRDSEQVDEGLRKHSEGGLYIGVGLGFTFLAGFVTASAGTLWPVLVAGLIFSLVGLIKAKGWPRRIWGLVAVGLSGGVFVGDFLVFLAGR